MDKLGILDVFRLKLPELFKPSSPSGNLLTNALVTTFSFSMPLLVTITFFMGMEKIFT